MTQAISNPTLKVQMTSMTPLEKVETVILMGQETTRTAANGLLLYPGEPGEILVRVENPAIGLYSGGSTWGERFRVNGILESNP